MKYRDSDKKRGFSGPQEVVILRNIAIAGSIFAMILCVLVIVNFIQVKRADPLNSKVMKVLVERMHANPEDVQLREEIRQIDLISRRAFFTSQWQVKVGGYLLFFTLLIVIICITAIQMRHKPIPELPGEAKTDFWTNRALNRSWLVYTGISMVAISFLVVFLTHRELGKELSQALKESVNQGKTETGKAGIREMETRGTPEIRNADSLEMKDSVSGTSPAVLDGYPAEQEIYANFPSFRGPGGNGIAFQKNIPTSWDGKTGKNLKWKTEIPLPGYNSPIIWNDRVFLTGASGSLREVYCIDINSGRILWKKTVEKIPGSPSQEPKIISETGYSAPTMTTDGRRVYAIFANGDLIALDFNGNQVWAKNLGMPQNHYGHSSSLIMYHDLLMVQYDQRGSGKVMAINGKTGETTWQTTRNVKVSWASPILVNTGKRMELILAAEPVVASYNPATGMELWHIDCISGEVGPSAAYADGVVYAVNDFSKLSAVEAGESPKILWEDSDYLSDIPSPVATEKYLFLVTSYGAVVCYDAKNGKKFWEKELETPVFSSLMLAEGNLFVLNKRGVMHILRADEKYHVISESPLGENSSCTPAFANGRIIIRGDKNLYCFGK